MDLSRRSLFGVLGMLAARTPAHSAAGPSIRQIDILHLSHTDFGYTDQPSIARELHRRYLDMALDACRSTVNEPDASRFHWTAESMIVVNDWWQAASNTRRDQFVEAIQAGQIDVNALACNNSPFMNAAQWSLMTGWVPDDLWRLWKPRIGIQDDANGFPRAGALKLLDRGVTRFLMGLNTDSGGSPFPRPTAFWWRMPDRRRMFVYLSEHYGAGLSFFQENWRSQPSPRVADGFLRGPRPGEILASDEESVRKAHARCLERLVKINGYPHERLLISITNQWRYDNDPPFPAVKRFVAEWNRLGLEPRLRLTTASRAMADMEELVGSHIPTYEGEWTDWWANGTMSAPREVAASRIAKRCVAVAASQLWGPMSPGSASTADAILRDLVLFDEHTWGSSDSISMPYALDTQAQFAAKAMLAYDPMARAELLLSERMHQKFGRQPEGIYVTNTTRHPFSGWLRFATAAIGSNFETLQSLEEGWILPVDWQAVPGKLAESYSPQPPEAKADTRSVGRVWIQSLAPGTTVRFRPDVQPPSPITPAAGPEIKNSDDGWPRELKWQGSPSLLTSTPGDLVVVQANTNRGIVARMAAGGYPPAEQEQKRKEVLIESRASAGKTDARETPYSWEFTQTLSHPRLKYCIREMTVWKAEPRIRLKLRIYRLDSESPESFYIAFQLPTGNALPLLSSGGVAFTPFRDQLGEVCRDYLAVDGWARYQTHDGDWLWVTRDAPLVTIGGTNTLARLTSVPAEPGRICAMLFNNHWHTNFVANQIGSMEFQFDLLWRRKIDDPAAVADSVMTEPSVLVNPKAEEDPIVEQYLYRRD